MSKIFRKTDTFSIFKDIVPTYQNREILDFGGNRGNLIATSNGEILEKNYTCLDISKDSLDILSKEYPDVKTVHWNRYHSTYNPEGKKNEGFPNINGHWLFGNIGEYPQFDIAFANSVFTHHDVSEMLYCIRHLSIHANEIYFTYIDPNNKDFFQKYQEKYRSFNLSDDQWDQVTNSKISYILDHNRVVSDQVRLKDDYDNMWAIFDTNYLKDAILSDSIRPIVIDSGIGPWFNWIKISVKDHRQPTLGIFGY